MNKIIVIGKEITNEINDDIKVSIYDDFIKRIKISILKNTDLYIETHEDTQIKFAWTFEIAKKIKCNIYEYKTGKSCKDSYNYDLNENSELNIYRLNDIIDNKEMIMFNLNGKYAKLKYILKTVSIGDEKYDVLVYHNKANTESLLNNHGVNIGGKIKFNVSGFVFNGNKNCILNQNSRIINLTNNKCQINPNLFIDEHDVIANHSAHIGKCNEEELFYLMSRGLHENSAKELLIKGFLTNGLNGLTEKCEEVINKYWR